MYKRCKIACTTEDPKSKEEAEDIEKELADKHAEGILDIVRSEKKIIYNMRKGSQLWSSVEI